MPLHQEIKPHLITRHILAHLTPHSDSNAADTTAQ